MLKTNSWMRGDVLVWVNLAQINMCTALNFPVHLLFE